MAHLLNEGLISASASDFVTEVIDLYSQAEAIGSPEGTDIIDSSFEAALCKAIDNRHAEAVSAPLRRRKGMG